MIMGKYTFKEIKKSVFEWSQKDILKCLSRHDEIVISKNNNEVLLFDLTFDNCIAQLIVSNPYFAPYQFVSFEAMTLDSEKAKNTGKPEMVYFFYDSAIMSKREVLNELGMGIKYCSDYIPDQLIKMYLNKIGILTIEDKNLNYIVHPDDIKKINAEIMKEEFICKDVKAQYLVVKGTTISLNVLPQAFTIIQP